MTCIIKEAKSAKGVRGFIIRVGDGHLFRVYNEDYTFVDYDILHHDLEVVILDEAVLYQSLYNGELSCHIDYPPIEE